MDTSGSLDIVVGGFSVVSFDAEWFVVVLERLPLCVDVVGIDSVYGVFDGSLKDLITVIEGFDAEGFVVVLECLSMCDDVVGVDGAHGVFDGSLEGLITLTGGFLLAFVTLQ